MTTRTPLSQPTPQVLPDNFPAKTKLWPILVESASRRHLGGGIRLYFIARSLSAGGSGVVEKEYLHAYLRLLGVQEKTIRRWTAQAEENVWMCSYRRAGTGTQAYRIASPDKVAKSVGCHDIGRYPVLIQATCLVSTGWKSYVWAGYESTHHERPVTRATHTRLTGVPRQTQIDRERVVPILKRQNRVITDIPADHWIGYRENKNRAVYVHVRDDGKAVLAYQMGNSVIVPMTVAEECPRGRSKKYNQNLRYQTDSSNVGRVQADAVQNRAGRIYFERYAHAEQKVRSLRRRHDLMDRPEEVFYQSKRVQTGPKEARRTVQYFQALQA
jgi:hypothetical protein